MKMKETLTLQQKTEMFLNGAIVGLFDGLFNESDPFYSFANSMCVGYYTVRSANKTVAPIYEQLLEYVQENGQVGDDYITLTNRLLGSTIIRPKFIDKWNRVYKTLITQQYNPLDGFDYTEHKTGNNSDVTSYDTQDKKSGTNVDTTTYDTSTEDNGKTGTKEVTTTSRENSADVYGFNSSSPVGDNVDTENATETLVGNADDNTSHNVQTKTGTDTNNRNINETLAKTGQDTKVFTVNEDITKSGRDSTGAEMVEAELNLRNTQLFFDIVYRDIDSIATIHIYN